MKCKKIHIGGNTNELKELIKKRVSDRMLHKIVEEKDAEIIIYFSSKKNENISFNKPTILLRPWNENIIPLKINNCIELQIRDLLWVNPNDEWAPPDVFEWYISIRDNKDLDLKKFPIRYWIPTKDVIILIETLIELEEFPTLFSVVCGRRPWVANDVYSELKLLSRRAHNAKLHQIDEIDLGINSIPLTHVDNNNKSPNLSKLHNLIKSINGNGWKPSTPLRISLMECIEKLIGE